MKHETKIIALLLLPAVMLMAAACSTQKNTASSRWWHSFHAKYNTYYNGAVAYIDGSMEKEQGNVDNFTEIIPLYTVGNKASREIGKNNFDRAITKSEKAIHLHSIKNRPVWDKKRRKTASDIEWLNRREYNPFLWKAWLLMGRSQFHSGQFEDAASTFSYMSRLYSTQPAIYGKARAWLAKSYIEQGWMYDAEDVIRNIRRDSLDWRAVKEWDYTYADYYIHTGEYAKAIPYLQKVIRHEMRRKQKAREWYLLGQLEAALGHRDQAYRAFRKVTRMNPPYEIEFNARIAMTEVMAGGQAHKMIGRLKSMAASDKNKDYLDQVYYAIGNINLSQKDTLNAINAYEQGNRKATRSGIEKGVLLLHLGNLYWERQQFGDAGRCYNEAIGLLDKDRNDYGQLSERAKMLDQLVPHTEAIHLQDSLQTLAKMSEKDRNAAIDRVIAALKKKEKEERDAQAVQDATRAGMQNSGNPVAPTGTPAPSQLRQGNQQWYFYNPTAVSQGKATFQRIWGKRENVDNWQRINKTVVAGLNTPEEMTDTTRDSLLQATQMQDSLRQRTDSAQNDPHRREYYLAQIPFTEEQLQESNRILEDALCNAGVILKDRMDNLTLSERHLRRLTDHYPDYEHTDNAYYHLFLLYSRMNRPEMADRYVKLLQARFPDSQWTALLTDPYFKENARLGTHMEDSLYASTYDAFKAGRYAEVKGNARISDTRFPSGANRDKFIFIAGLSMLNDGDPDGCLANMQKLVKGFPESRLGEMAGMIINGVKAGRRLRGGKFDLGNIWERRSVVLNDSDSIAVRSFSPDRNAAFVFFLAYSPDSLNENQLLFEIAKFNFTSFLVRNFDVTIEEVDGLHRMVITGFRNYDEALQYARQLYDQGPIIRLLNRGRPFVISQPNLDLLGNPFSYDDYNQYYTKHFAPLKVSTFRLLTEPADVETRPEKQPAPEETDRTLDDGLMLDNELGLPASGTGTTVTPDSTVSTQSSTDGMTIPVHQQTREKTAGMQTTVIPERTETPRQTTGSSTTVIPRETSAPTSRPRSTGTTIPATTPKAGSAKTASGVSIPATPPAPKPKKSSTGIYFGDRKAEKAASDKQKGKAAVDKKKQEKKKKKDYDLEDEYYDLEGF